MSDAGPAALTGTVAAVVAAFEQGEALVKSLKQKRAQEGAPPPPPALEQSFIRGPRAVREAYETGWETYGEAFQVEKDRVALDAFKDILISLQGTIFQQLFAAQGDNTMNDFGIVLKASNMGRARSLQVLNEMFMRMTEAAPSPAWMSPQTGQSQYASEPLHLQQMSPGQESSFTSPAPGFNWEGQNYRMRTDITVGTTGAFESPLTATPSASSHYQPNYTHHVMSNSITHSPASSHNTALTSGSEEADFSTSPASFKKTLQSTNPPPKPRDDSFQADHAIHPANFRRRESISSDGKSQYNSSSGASFVSRVSPETALHTQATSSPQSTSTNNSGSKFLFQGSKIPFHASPPAEHRKRLNNKPKLKRSTTAESPSSSPRPSFTPSKSGSRKFSLLGGPKAPKQDCAGFCEGAHLIQIGQDGMKIRNQSVSMTGQNNYWACSNSKCCFEGCAVQKKDENKKTGFVFDEDILEAYGVRYRWRFLAKSHTTIGNSKAGYEYQCPFCVGQSAPCFRVKGDRKFMEHVATHQGQTPNEAKMPRFNYVVGRHASDWEDFDVNLSAETARELETMETPAELDAPLPALPEMEAPLECLRPLQHMKRPTPATNGHTKETNRSGLGIRMIGGTHAEGFSGQKIARRASVHSGYAGMTTSVESDVDWRDDCSQRRFLNGRNSNEEMRNNNDGVDNSNSGALEKSWTEVRDSLYNLHPAPLFAKKSAAAKIVSERERDQQQQAQGELHQQPHQHPYPQPHQLQQQSQRHEPHPQRQQSHHHRNHHQGQELTQKALPEPPPIIPQIQQYTDPYQTFDRDIHPLLRGRRSSDPWRASNATLSLENKYLSRLRPEPPRQITTPDLWHPGTKWMD